MESISAQGGRLYRCFEVGANVQSASGEIGSSYSTVASVVEKLIDCDILIKTSNVAKNRTFAYQEYLQLLRKDT